MARPAIGNIQWGGEQQAFQQAVPQMALAELARALMGRGAGSEDMLAGLGGTLSEALKGLKGQGGAEPGAPSAGGGGAAVSGGMPSFGSSGVGSGMLGAPGGMPGGQDQRGLLARWLF